MSLEAKIDELIVAINANTAARKGEAGAAATGGKPDKPKVDKTPPKSKYTATQVQTAVVEVKDAKGSDAAKEIIEKYAGEGEKLAKLITMPEKFEAVMAACAEALADDGSGDDDDI